MTSKWEFSQPDSPTKSRRSSRSSGGAILDTIRDLGFRDIENLDSCSEEIKSAIWKLISMSQEGVRSLMGEKERTARLEHELKVAKSRISKLSDEIEKLKSDQSAALADGQKREEMLRDKLDSLGRSRTEWEKVALEYRGREKHFVAEIKKQESEYSRFQDKVRRSMSVANRNAVTMNDQTYPSPPIFSSNIQRSCRW